MEIREVVREKYGQAALRVSAGGSSCCGARAALDGCCDPIPSNLYDAAQAAELPAEAVLASLGCGNPTALAELKPGEIVLDLGSGGSVDVVISNCVINLSGDKDRALREAFRVLKPGGRFAVSDIVTRGRVPEDVRGNLLLWVGCIAGALEDYQYVAKLARAGFENIDVEPTRVYSIEDARMFLSRQGVDVEAMAPAVEGKFMSAFIRATKPAGCCAAGCCQ
jgi:SAM-dependent methyltransferase